MSSNRNIRRDFLLKAGLLSAAFCFALLQPACKKEVLDLKEYPGQSVRIKELNLRTKSLIEARQFWESGLGFQVIDSSPSSITFQVGDSRLTFRNQTTINPPVYHFAIAIPSNQVENALDWLKNQDGKYPDGPPQPVPILKDESSGAEIIYNAPYQTRSVFFRDPNGQVVELVGRELADNAVEGDFNRSMMMGITNFSLVTKEVRKCEDILRSEFGFKAFPNTTSGYKPVGGIDGTLTLIIPGRPYIPTESLESVPYTAIVTVQHPQPKEIVMPGSEVLIKTEP